jgi:hypothetical protein
LLLRFLFLVELLLLLLLLQLQGHVQHVQLASPYGCNLTPAAACHSSN